MRRQLLTLVFLGLLILPASGESPPPGYNTPWSPPVNSEALTTKELFSIMNERERAINQRFELQDKAVNAALAAAKEAVTAALVAAKEAVQKAEVAAEKRFDSVNEFRNTLRDQQATLISKSEADIRFKGLEDKLTIVMARQSKESGNFEGAAWLWGVLIGGGGLVIAGAALFSSRRREDHRRNNR